MRLTPLERLEALAEDVLGRGAAVSVDGSRHSLTIAIWDAQGNEVLREGGGRAAAISTLTARLRERLATRSGAA